VENGAHRHQNLTTAQSLAVLPGVEQQQRGDGSCYAENVFDGLHEIVRNDFLDAR